MHNRSLLAALGAVITFAACSDGGITAPDAARPSTNLDRERVTGAVYTLTNSTAGNAVAIFDRRSDGALTFSGSVPTGGVGTGRGLGSQGALTLRDDGRWLLAVNAASNDVSVLEVRDQGLVLRDRAPSQGTGPVSVTIRKNLVYVLNAGGAGNIAGFTLTSDGALVPIPSSVRPLSSSAAAAAQISFSPDGESLVVTERATQVIGVYALGKDGVATGVTSYPSSGATPFGFDFSGRGKLIVSEAFGGAAGASAVSSYRLSRRDALSPVSKSVPTSQTAACWLVVSKDGRFAYAANAGSASITGYAIARDGMLTRLDAGRTGVVGAGATDVAVSENGRYLYVLTQGAGTVSAFEIQPDGSLTAIAPASGAVGGAVGLAAR